MKLNVPFFEQESKNSCAIACARMALAYFGKEVSEQQLYTECTPEESGVIWSPDVARLLATHGLSVEFYTRSLHLNPDLAAMDYYQQQTNVKSAADRVEQFIREGKKAGAIMDEKSVDWETIESKLMTNHVVLVLLNWRVIKPKEGKPFTGHFVPLVGFDEKFVYIHQQDPSGGANPFMPIEKNVFEEARKSKGTDEDIIFVGKKK